MNFAAETYTPYFSRNDAKATIRPVEYDPVAKRLVVTESGAERTIFGLTHAQVKTWCKMQRPDAYLAVQLLDPRIKKANAPKAQPRPEAPVAKPAAKPSKADK